MSTHTAEARVILSGSFDDLRSRHVRLLQEAGRLGPVHVLLWSDDAVRALTGSPRVSVKMNAPICCRLCATWSFDAHHRSAITRPASRGYDPGLRQHLGDARRRRQR